MKILCAGSEKFCSCCEWSDRNILQQQVDHTERIHYTCR